MRRKKLGRFFRPILSLSIDHSKIAESSLDHVSTQKQTLRSSLTHNLNLFKEAFQSCEDVVFREFNIGIKQDIRAAIIWLDGLVDTTIINEDIIKPLLQHAFEPGDFNAERNLIAFFRDSKLNTADIEEKEEISDLIDSVLTGDCVILIDGYSVSLVSSAKGGELRSISEPVTEAVVRGPRQGFTENIRTNTSLLRRIVKTPQLKLESFKAGTLTKTDLTLAYIKGIANEKIVEEVRLRIRRINVDSILESAYVEELIEDQPYSPFPQIAHTERPDKAAAELLEGRVIILVDGTPFVLIVPALFIQFLQSSEDYYERYPMAFAIRIIRYVFFLMALLFPSVYIAATTYHQETLPTQLLISIAGAHEGVPFPAFFEALLMEITFEALREAGVRLPRTVGQAVSIVGALVIGESAVRAGIVSPAMVIVVAVTAIASFAIPAFNVAITIRLLRFPMMALAAVLGFYGIMLGLLVILIHLSSLRSFGVPYFAPVAPFQRNGMKDMIFRAPWWKMKKRPEMLSQNNLERQNTPKPKPPTT